MTQERRAKAGRVAVGAEDDEVAGFVHTKKKHTGACATEVLVVPLSCCSGCRIVLRLLLLLLLRAHGSQ